MGNEPFHVTDANFDKTVKNNKVVLLDFWAGWCGPCRALAPTIEELAKEYAGKVLVGKLDVDENPNTAEQFQVYSIPTVVILKDCCEVDRIVGLCSKQRYVDALKKQVEKKETTGKLAIVHVDGDVLTVLVRAKLIDGFSQSDEFRNLNLPKMPKEALVAVAAGFLSGYGMTLRERYNEGRVMIKYLSSGRELTDEPSFDEPCYLVMVQT